MYYKDLLRYRQVWLGVALLWVIFFHLPLNFGPLNFLKEVGYGGVDICFFASGIGCFYSLSTNSDAVSFMKRRLKRLIPTYGVFIFFWLAYQYAAGYFGFQMAIGNLLALQSFTGHGDEFNWYISAILLFYLLAPYLMAIAKHPSTVCRNLFLLLLLACSIPFWRAETYIIFITRLPVFYMGMLFADLCKKDSQVCSRHVIGLAAVFILGVAALVYSFAAAPEYLWSHGLYWYPFILITPPLCIAVSCVSRILESAKSTKWIVSFLSLCGSYSFELYLMHILLISCLSDCILRFDLARIRYLVWAAGGLLLFAGCFLLRRVTALVSDIFCKQCLKNS